ncbi:TetR/AcrR family transcriptional regulator [Rummeliibacillus stabekisii]|uniref:TetR/AcrR family transcriptional regulator n=1 Tax=Rummeliibacillus stabekisii TaxID=241244 RepID=UPI0011BEF6DD|nr:TetR/AcrR family transcriptional regulator [Rummeliibacillus stabekisii]MBB5170522.1 AcrR family transcriptional regulator [Rummeliibacillus stabekisii]
MENEQKKRIHTSIKDEVLIEKRRTEMIQGAVRLFKEKGFHRTTTREIAKSAGFSIGTLYEYIRTKEDILYLVCDRIYLEVQHQLGPFQQREASIEGLIEAITQYYMLVDSMQDEMLVMYQESKSLPKDALDYVLAKEIEMAGIFENLLSGCVELDQMKFSLKEIKLLAHQIVIQGQAWAFRRWVWRKDYKIEDYIKMQTNILLNGMLS